MIRPIPDWKLDKMVVLALPWARDVPKNREGIIRDYALFLKKNDVPVSVLVNERTTPGIIAALAKSEIPTLQIGAGDIWIRDWAPLLCERDGKTVAVIFQYPRTYPYAPAKDHKAGITLAGKLGLELVESKLIWEMGNFTTNGKTIIVTDQIMAANHLHSTEDLKRRLVDELDFDPKIEIHVLETYMQSTHLWQMYGYKWSDAISHSDGHMRFVDESTLIYALPKIDEFYKEHSGAEKTASTKKKKMLRVYANYCVENYKAVDRLAGILAAQGFKLIPIEQTLSVKDIDDVGANTETLSDIGDYINFLRFGKRLFLPQYCPEMSEAEDKAALDAYIETGIDVTPVNENFVLGLAHTGGVLNCASWVM